MEDRQKETYRWMKVEGVWLQLATSSCKQHSSLLKKYTEQIKPKLNYLIYMQNVTCKGEPMLLITLNTPHSEWNKVVAELNVEEP